MSRPYLLWLLVAMFVVLGCSAAALLYQQHRRAQMQDRLDSVRHLDTIAAGIQGQKARRGFAGLIAAMGNGLARSGLLSKTTVAGLEQTLKSAGLRGSSTLGLFVGAKLLLMVLLPLLTFVVVQRTSLSPLLRNGGVAVAALVGLLGPDWWVGRQYKQYLNAVVKGLPDALDLMVICAEAGLSFEPAISRVAVEIRGAHRAISDEFSQTASELRVVADSRVALTNMGTRTGLESVKRMTSMLAQTMRYGTPLSDALRVLSAEMRQEMLIRFETRAARLPVLLTLPMVLFILPCIFLIVGGPAVVQVMKSIHH